MQLARPDSCASARIQDKKKRSSLPITVVTDRLCRVLSLPTWDAEMRAHDLPNTALKNRRAFPADGVQRGGKSAFARRGARSGAWRAGARSAPGIRELA